MYPDPGAPPTISATYHKMKPGEEMGPAKLQILKSVLSEGEKQSRLEFIELCINSQCSGKFSSYWKAICFVVRLLH